MDRYGTSPRPPIPFRHQQGNGATKQVTINSGLDRLAATAGCEDDAFGIESAMWSALGLDDSQMSEARSSASFVGASSAVDSAMDNQQSMEHLAFASVHEDAQQSMV